MDAAQGRQGLLAEWRLALRVTQQRTESSDVSRPRGPAWRGQVALAFEVWPSPSTCSGHLQQLTEVTSASYTLSSSRVFPTALRSKLHASHKIKSNLAGSLFLYREQWSEKECCVLPCLDGGPQLPRRAGLSQNCVCTCKCMHVYIYVCGCIVYVCMCVCVLVCARTHAHVPMCLCVHARMCRCTCTCALCCTCMYTDVCMPICTASSTCVHTCALTCM